MATQRKQAIFIADSLENAYRFQKVLSVLDVDVSAGSSLQFRRLLAAKMNCDLVIYEARADALSDVAAVERSLQEAGGIPLLVIADDAMLGQLKLPMLVRCDFVMPSASELECEVRVRQLLRSDADLDAADLLTVDSMTINLATYQVQVGGEPVDFTYLEYALLAFLVTHPGHTFSRDALLRRVWGFDYYGGSRTVDVHVRRVRAKLGPDLAQHLETVRGVGYLWN